MTYNVFSGTLNPTQSINHQFAPTHLVSAPLMLWWRLFWLLSRGLIVTSRQLKSLAILWQFMLTYTLFPTLRTRWKLIVYIVAFVNFVFGTERRICIVRYMLWSSVCLSVCLSIHHEANWLNRWSWFSAQRLLLAYPALCRKVFCIPPKIDVRVLLSGTLSHTPTLAIASLPC